MKNVLLISPDFPYTYYQFARAFKRNGMTVLVIGSTDYSSLHPGLRDNVDEYCKCWNMENLDEMKGIVGYLINKYGPIDFLESNNEYWLRNDAILRETFGISSGIYPHQLDEYQKKSSMKKYFQEAGVKVAPYILVGDLDEFKAFAKKYGFPLFTKPDIGVGAAANYKLENMEQLEKFYWEKPYHVQYICEPFIESEAIQTFDGIADYDSNVVICDSLVCPPSIYDIKQGGADFMYYIPKTIDPEFAALGRKVVKAMGLKARFFHGEYFVAKNSVKGWFNKGDIVGLEVNIRTPGGYTPDLINFALSQNIYQVFADVVCFGKAELEKNQPYYSISCARRDGVEYFYSYDDVLRTYHNNICFYGRYPDILADIMGNIFFMAKFDDKKDMDVFYEYVLRRVGQDFIKTTPTQTKRKKLVGEDAKMMKEKNSKSSKSKNICDTHIDGA